VYPRGPELRGPNHLEFACTQTPTRVLETRMSTNIAEHTTGSVSPYIRCPRAFSSCATRTLTPESPSTKRHPLLTTYHNQVVPTMSSATIQFRAAKVNAPSVARPSAKFAGASVAAKHGSACSCSSCRSVAAKVRMDHNLVVLLLVFILVLRLSTLSTVICPCDICHVSGFN
jgi:hypothetical protein